MKKSLLPLFICLFFVVFQANAQSTPTCSTPNPPGAESCTETCIYCDLNGYVGINNGTPSGGNTVCGQIVLHNDQWFGFIAGSTNITINIATSNCQNGDGLQVAIFADCSDFDPVVCNSGLAGGAGQALELSYNYYDIGETYFLVVDGWSGDVCDYQIQVTEGITQPCGDVLTVCGDSCVTVCDSVFCYEGQNIAMCPDSSGNLAPYPFYFDRKSADATITGGGSITCNSPEVLLFAQTSNDQFAWLDSDGGFLSASQSFLVVSPGIYTLKVSEGPCQAQKSILVKQNNQTPHVSATGGTLDITHPTVRLVGHSITSGVKYFWMGPDGFTSTLKKPFVSVPGVYTLTVTHPGTGCSNSAEAVVVQE